MKLTSVGSPIGPQSTTEALDPERVDPPVQTPSISQTRESHLDTDSQAPAFQVGRLANLIEEAKKRAQLRKKKSGLKLRSQVANAYRKVETFEQESDEKGMNFDRNA